MTYKHLKILFLFLLPLTFYSETKGQTINSEAVIEICSTFPSKYKNVTKGVETLSSFLLQSHSILPRDSGYSKTFKELFFSKSMEKYRHYFIGEFSMLSNEIIRFNVDGLVYFKIGDEDFYYKDVSATFIYNILSDSIILNHDNYIYFPGVTVKTHNNWQIFSYNRNENITKRSFRLLRKKMRTHANEMGLGLNKLGFSDDLILHKSATRFDGYFYYGITFSQNYSDRNILQNVFIGDFKDYHDHEFTHYIHSKNDLYFPNQILNEGLTTIYGGSGERSYDDLLDKYKISHSLQDFDNFLNSSNHRAGQYIEKAIFVSIILQCLESKFSTTQAQKALTQVSENKNPREILFSLDINAAEFNSKLIILYKE